MAKSAPDQSGSDDLLATAFGTLGRHGGKRGRQAALGWALVSTTLPAVRWVRKQMRERATYTVTVNGADDIYPELHEWVLSSLPAGERRALIADSGSVLDDDGPSEEAEVYDGGRRPVPSVRLRYDGHKVQTIRLGGHKVTVEIQQDEFPGGRDRIPPNWRQLVEKIVFTASSEAGRDAVVAQINILLAIKAATDGPPPLLMPGRWGDNWERRQDLPPRRLDSVILKWGQLERLTKDLKGFLDAESEYNRVNRPWHRGYLFWGPPGTGKTSVARALADHFHISVYYLPLADIEKDRELVHLMNRVPPRSMLLIEDVDIYRVSAKRKQKEDATPGATLSVMLNALDGVWTPHGLITVLTTNNRDVLDPALLREGRVDVEEEFTLLDEDQAERLMAWYGGNGCRPGDFTGRSPAELIGTLYKEKG